MAKQTLGHNKVMAKKSGTRLKLALKCTVCKSTNYITSRNKLNTPEKLHPLKYCKRCRIKTEHKEVEKLK